MAAGLNLTEDEIEPITLEAPAGGRRRIDVEVGSCVFEVKRDLRVGNVLVDGIEQLAGYVADRTATLGRRYVGVLTDGADWRLYRLDQTSGTLDEVAQFGLNPNALDVDGLCSWLESVMATVDGIAPTPREIRSRLGFNSTAHALDTSDLHALYNEHRQIPTVQLKRELWARLLTTAFGTEFDDSDYLFVEHTLLVVTAELIAHAVVDIDPTDPQVSPAALLSGTRFAEASIGGVVESDFFDWIVEVPGGGQFVRALARRLSRFEWNQVEHDVMKVLYESVIPQEERKKLGEYYTPDWLAERIVGEVVDRPLEQRVLDPAYGSGTFLFYAVRHALDAADAAGWTVSQAIETVTRQVSGIDVHPVAVTLARVTYLLAIGWDRLNDPERPGFNVPVYLGDSLQWGQKQSLFDSENLVVRTNDQASFWEFDLLFPRSLLQDVGRFDQLVSEMATRAGQPAGSKSPLKSLFRRYGIVEADQPTIGETFEKMRHLHEQGRDHIWGYFVRNVARPAWMARTENRVDRIVGNPPWLSYRFMTRSMQDEFRDLTKAYGLWSTNASVATHQDLSGLFVARTTQMYLADGGKFGFVMPNPVLTRRQYTGFRTGRFGTAAESFTVAFTTPWDLEPVRPIFFPQASCVVFGTRTSESAVALPHDTVQWSGRLPDTNPTVETALSCLVRSNATQLYIQHEDSQSTSPYRSRFAQGATLVPRFLMMVEDAPTSGLGIGAGRKHVRSRRSPNEKRPWKDLPAQVGTVETAFLRPVYTGEQLLPFRAKEPHLCVIPWGGESLLDVGDDRIADYPGFEEWWRTATNTWELHRSSDRLSLSEQVDYRGKLTDQYPIPTHRVVYSASSINLSACRIEDTAGIIDNSLYWATTSSPREGHYLEAILNSAVTLKILQPMQARGKDSPRHIHMTIWNLPIPEFDPTDSKHLALEELARLAEEEAATVQLRPGDFRLQRRQIRERLTAVGLESKIDSLVSDVLSA